MKYIKKYNEVSSYSSKNDETAITIVKRDKIHTYEYCDNVLYELSNTGNDIIVDIENVYHTEENMFYQDHIDRYVEYIDNGGIIQTFPVQEIKKCENLEEMLEYIDNEKEGFDIAWNLFNYNHITEFSPKNEKMNKIYMKRGLSDIIINPEEYGFSLEYSPTKRNKRNTYDIIDLSQIRTIKDLEKSYHDFEDEEPNKNDFEDEDEYNDAIEEWKEKCSKYDDDILLGLIEIIKYFEDECEYHLTDFNHRFAAIKELGKTRVYVEIIK